MSEEVFNVKTAKEIERIMERARHELMAVVLSEPPVEIAKESPPVQNGMTDVKGACDYLKCSETEIRKMVRDGRLPERRIGTRLRFKFSDLDSATMKPRLKKVG